MATPLARLLALYAVLLQITFGEVEKSSLFRENYCLSGRKPVSIFSSSRVFGDGDACGGDEKVARFQIDLQSALLLPPRRLTVHAREVKVGLQRRKSDFIFRWLDVLRYACIEASPASP